MRNNMKNQQSGFTVVELMVSTIIFSLILVAAMAGLVQIGRLYYRGITTARTQEQTRNVMAELSQSIQFTRVNVRVAAVQPSIPIDPDNSDSDSDPAKSFFCVGPRRYTFMVDRKLSFDPDTNPDLSSRRKESRHVLWVDTPSGGCEQSWDSGGVTAADMRVDDPCSDGSCSNGVEILSENTRITKLNLLDNGNGTWNVELALAYGEDDLLSVDVSDPTRYVCEGSFLGVEFCAISELSTTVLRRL